MQEPMDAALKKDFWLSGANAASSEDLLAAFLLPGDPMNLPGCIDIVLDKDDGDKVRFLCNDSAALVFNFYGIVLSILLNKYSPLKEFLLISPRNLFEDTQGEEEFFLFRSMIDDAQHFKQLFAASKKQMALALGYTARMEEITAFIGQEKTRRLSRIDFQMGQGETPTVIDGPDLLFRLFQEGERYIFRIEPRMPLFNHRIGWLFGNNFRQLLGEIIKNIYTPVGELDWRSEDERQSAEAFNRTEEYFPLDRNLVEWVGFQAHRSPDKKAIVHRERSITYAGLWNETNQLARVLADRLRPNGNFLVGVMMPRSIEMAKCILAIWKAGGAYVPIGLHYPPERLLQMIKSSGLSAIIVDGGIPEEDAVAREGHVQVMSMDEITTASRMMSKEDVSLKIKDDDLAYVIYTSGSTGIPKGVMIEQLGMLNHIGSKVVELGIEADSKVAQNAPHTFDISVWQFFSAMVAGGTTIIYDDEILSEPEEFIRQLNLDGTTVLELVPSYFIEMLGILEDDRSTAGFGSMKIIVLNAETLTPAMVKRWLALYPGIPIVNTYGATEVSDDISHYIMRACPETATIPVMRRPIQHFGIYLVDQRLLPVPIGTKGEILISGMAVGRGYINDKERTAQSFLPGPIPGVTDQIRNYLTGDIGRQLPDGTLEFLGRKDAQIKIRGQRVEPGEIELALTKIPEIRNAAVIEDEEKQHLIAFYQSDEPLTRETITDVIRTVLPDYMIPAYYVHLPKFPLSANGKIDKRELLQLASGERMATGLYIAPRNETEEKMVSIWREILGKDKIGIHDNFFDVGGHSLRAMRLLTHVHKEFNIKILLKDFFENPTVEWMCADISRKRWIKGSAVNDNADTTSNKALII